MQNAVSNHPVPPLLNNGRAIPFVGMSAVTTSIFMQACKPTVTTIPNAISCKNVFVVFRITYTPSTTSPMYKQATAKAPKKPSSSQMTEYIKSVVSCKYPSRYRAPSPRVHRQKSRQRCDTRFRIIEGVHASSRSVRAGVHSERIGIEQSTAKTIEHLSTKTNSTTTPMCLMYSCWRRQSRSASDRRRSARCTREHAH